MPCMRPNNRIFSMLALCAAATVCAAPALAAEPVASDALELRLGVSKLAGWAERAARAERRHERAEGPFGAARSGHTHAGQDIFAKPGTLEIAATDGVVLETGSDGGQGNYVYL